MTDPAPSTTPAPTLADRLTFIASRLESRAGVTVLQSVGELAARDLRQIAAEVEEVAAVRHAADVLNRLVLHLTANGAVVISHTAGAGRIAPHFATASQWGQEAQDSPMAAAAAYGIGDTVVDALEALLDDAGVPKAPPA